MLDDENPTPNAPDASEPPAAPPRRRRSASRPAGPPAPVVAAQPVIATPESGAASDDETSLQADVLAPSEPPVSSDGQTENVPKEGDADADKVDGTPADEAAVDGTPADRPSDEAPADEAEPVDEPRAERAAEADLEQIPAPDERVAQADDVPFTLEVEPEAPAPRRRRSTRATAAPVVIEPVSPVDEPVAEQVPLSLDELPTLDQLAPAVETRGRRRRPKADSPKTESRKAEPTAQSEAEPEQPAEPADPIEETLTQLSRTGRRGRRAKVDQAEAAKALDELAAMIGGQHTDAEPTAAQGEIPELTVALTELELASDAVAETEGATGRPADVGSEQDTVDEENSAEEDPSDEEDAVDEEDAGDEEDSADEEDSGDDDSSDEDSPRRRRRRRGGRRRRRGSGTDSADGEVDTADDEDAGDANDTNEGEATGEGESSESAESSGSTRRRRRRRRRGEDTAGAEDDPSDVVVRVREPRRTRSANDEVTSIEGSTRMEAKRQRRREGRAAGRRRSPILSEAEFLARRESVERTMLIRQADDYTQIGVLEDGVLVEHYVDRASAASMIGNIYLGKVQNVLPSMEAAFIDIGRGRNAVLYAGEVDWDAAGVTGGDRKMEKVFKSGQSVLVQVSKDPIGAKGARLTAHVSIPGRYVVYSPSGQLSGISRKLPEQERNRLKGILEELVGDTASVIVRTAAEGASEEELVRDVNRLKAQWEVIEQKVKAGKSPEQLYAEPDLTVRIVRDLFTEDFCRLIVDGNGKGEDAYDTVEAYVTHVAPHLKERLVHWNRDEQGDVFASHRVDEQIAKALERKVFLPSGGSLIIDRTEAMTVIDVNTGKFTGTSGNLEATVTSNNLEAAEEVVRQLRLRDIGGIIVIDFIDMVLPANRELLLRRLVECLGRDRTRHQVAEVTSLGLVQMTRKKIGTGLAEAFTVPCETCHGRGYHRHDTPVDSQVQADGGDREHGRRRR